MIHPFRRRQQLSTITFTLLFSGLVSLATHPTAAKPRELIRNGNFAQGLARWTSVASDNGIVGTFTAATVGANTPRSGIPTASNAKGGALYALSDQSNRSFQALGQKFRVPKSAERVTLTYQMFVRSEEAIVKGSPFFNSMISNQQARVDVLKGSSPLLANGGFVQALYPRGADAVKPMTAVPYRGYRFNLSRKLKPGRTYQIRFAAVATAGPVNVGVDNVSVESR